MNDRVTTAISFPLCVNISTLPPRADCENVWSSSADKVGSRSNAPAVARNAPAKNASADRAALAKIDILRLGRVDVCVRRFVRGGIFRVTIKQDKGDPE